MELFPNNPIKLVHIDESFKCGSMLGVKQSHVTELIQYLMKCTTTEIVLHIGYDPRHNVDWDYDDDEDFTEYQVPNGVETHLCGKIDFKNQYPKFSKDYHSILAWPMGIRSVEYHMLL